MGTQRIQGIIFDLDGTLYQMKFMKLKMSLQLLKSIVFLRKLGAARTQVRSKKFDGRRELLDAFYDELAQRTGRSVAESQAWYENDFYEAFNRFLKRSATPRQGLIPLLNRLKQKQIKLAVVSDFDQVHNRLSSLGIDANLFDVAMCSEESGALKPSSEPFLTVAQLWNIMPENILVVGDRADRDGDGARNAGMAFLGITDKKHAHADFYCWNDAMRKIETTTNCGENV